MLGGAIVTERFLLLAVFCLTLDMAQIHEPLFLFHISNQKLLMNFMFPSCLGYVHFEVENGDDNKENQDHSGSNSNPHAGTATILALR